MVKRRFSISAAIIGVVIGFVGIIVSLRFSGLLHLHWQPSSVGMTSLAIFTAPALALDAGLHHLGFFLLDPAPILFSCIAWGFIAGSLWPLIVRRGTQTI
jgi:hypothetical protein